ncbi:MAG: hypothetical protein H7X77_07490 [Anaerolineae bacterium]|nr:hypothetical protein [Anaerolineae bacterium]
MTQRDYPSSRLSPGLFPPWWSILLTLLMVGVCAGSLVLVVVLLGGNAAPAQPPRLVVLTAASVDNFVAESLVIVTVPSAEATQAQAQSSVSFVMSGPTLPPPAITPTAISISIGATIRVIDVGDQQLNVRERPGVIDVDVAFRSPENTLFTIVDGPSQADGLTWWKIQDPENNLRSGWAASNYLEVVPPQPE